MNKTEELMEGLFSEEVTLEAKAMPKVTLKAKPELDTCPLEGEVVKPTVLPRNISILTKIQLVNGEMLAVDEGEYEAAISYQGINGVGQHAYDCRVKTPEGVMSLPVTSRKEPEITIDKWTTGTAKLAHPDRSVTLFTNCKFSYVR